MNYDNETLEEKRQRLLRELYVLRDSYSSEIPEQAINNEGEHKVRSVWFGATWLYFDILFRNQFIPESLIKKRDETLQEIKSRRESNKGLTCRLDIEEVDQLLTEAIKYLESQ